MRSVRELFRPAAVTHVLGRREATQRGEPYLGDPKLSPAYLTLQGMRVVRGGHRWAAETVENAWWRAYTAPSCRSRIRELVSQLSQIGAAQR